MQEENEDDCDEDGDQEWTGEDFKKWNVEDSLQSYVLTNKCRWILTDTYFGNSPQNTNGTSSSNSNFNLMPTQFTEYTVPCCDNCLKDKNPTKEFPLITDMLSKVFGTSLTDPKIQTPPNNRVRMLAMKMKTSVRSRRVVLQEKLVMLKTWMKMVMGLTPPTLHHQGSQVHVMHSNLLIVGTSSPSGAIGARRRTTATTSGD